MRATRPEALASSTKSWSKRTPALALAEPIDCVFIGGASMFGGAIVGGYLGGYIVGMIGAGPAAIGLHIFL
jgi:ABC-type xylose transport system permease subunit